jgi:hypothetical protein
VQIAPCRPWPWAGITSTCRASNYSRTSWNAWQPMITGNRRGKQMLMTLLRFIEGHASSRSKAPIFLARSVIRPKAPPYAGRPEFLPSSSEACVVESSHRISGPSTNCPLKGGMGKQGKKRPSTADRNLIKAIVAIQRAGGMPCAHAAFSIRHSIP